MANSPSNNDTSQKEMFKLLKIFGLTSLGLVLVLSLFNGHRANNSGEDPTFKIKDAGLLFFYNLRRIDYQVQRLTEAKIEIYTHSSFEKDSTHNTLLLDLILNKNKQTAFLYLKPQGVFLKSESLKLRNGKLQDQETLTLNIGTADRHIHLEASKKIAQWLQQEEGFVEVYTNNKWNNLFQNKNQKDAFNATFIDFLKITANK